MTMIQVKHAYDEYLDIIKEKTELVGGRPLTKEEDFECWSNFYNKVYNNPMWPDGLFDAPKEVNVVVFTIDLFRSHEKVKDYLFFVWKAKNRVDDCSLDYDDANENMSSLEDCFKLMNKCTNEDMLANGI